MSLESKILKTMHGITLPSYDQAEKCLLGYILYNTDVQDYVFEKLLPKHFYSKVTSSFYALLLKMHKKKIGIDLVTVAQEVERSKLTEWLEKDGHKLDYYTIIEWCNLSQEAIFQKINANGLVETLITVYTQRQIMQIANKAMYLANMPTSNIDAPHLLEEVEKSFEVANTEYYATIDSDLSKIKYDQDKEIPDFKPVLSVATETGEIKPICEQGAIFGIIGAKGSRKTFLLFDLVACFLGCESDIGFEVPDHAQKGNILFIDTEQRERTFSLSCNKVKSKLYRKFGVDKGWEIMKERFHAYPIADKDEKERKAILKRLMRELKPSLVVVDGIVDMVEDYNDRKESKQFTNTIMKYRKEYNCIFMYVLHTAKSTGLSRGHLGTEMDNKSEVMIKTELVEDAPECTKVSCYKNREGVKFKSFEFTQNFSNQSYIQDYSDTNDKEQIVLDVPF